MIVHDNNIETEIGPLIEDAVYRIEDGLFAISDRYDDTCFYRKCFVRSWNGVEIRLEPCRGSLQMRGSDALHFDLILAIPRIDVIELFFACGPHIRGGRAI